MTTLSLAQRELLRLVRREDEDAGGLRADELSADELEILTELVRRGLVEFKSAFGEAPDGEEDEREAGAGEGLYRVTGAGVAALRAADEAT